MRPSATTAGPGGAITENYELSGGGAGTENSRVPDIRETDLFSVLSERTVPLTVEAAEADFPRRKALLLRAWGRRLQATGLPAWNDNSPTATRLIAAGMAALTDGSVGFTGADWALFSGRPETEARPAHQAAFAALVENYCAGVYPYTQPGTDGPGKPEDASGDSGDYDFALRDIVALIHLFLDRPEVLTNDAIRMLITQQEVSFTPAGDTYTVEGGVPFAGQDLNEWLGAGPNGRHYFLLEIPIVSEFPVDLVLPDPAIKMATPETENHLLGIYAWRFLVNEYLTFVSRLQPGDARYHRFDPQLAALVEADPGRYVNGPEIIDFVLQLLGRVAHSGMYESNAKPYGMIAASPILAFYQAADLLFPDDPDRQRIKVAAHNALDYLAAEFTFQSLEGKRIAPFRRNVDHRDDTSFYTSDYAPHMFGALTGSYVFPDGDGGPFGGTGIDQEGGFALWAVLSGYRVPRAIHDLALNKHGGYFARVQTRYSKASYPLEITIGPGGPGGIGKPPNPPFVRPRYFQDIDVEPPEWGVPGPGEFTPATQLYFATPDYLNSSGGHNLAYYFEIEVPLAVVDLLIAGTTGLPPIPGLRNLVRSWLNRAINGMGFVRKIRGSDVNSRPSTLITRGDLQPGGGANIGGLEAVLPAMRGQDDYWSSKNVSVYKSFSLGYTFRPGGHDRHLTWPQRYPAGWDASVVQRFGIGRAAIQVFDFVDQPDHPLSGHFWVLGQFSKSENKGQFREYGRGFWEVVPGHQFPDGAALAARIKELNPGSHFDDDADNDYAYRMATTAETVVIHNRFGSSATDQAILELRSAAGEKVPLNRYLADMGNIEKLREIPLLDVWQVDRDHGFTGLKYAHADGHGRIVLHNPLVGQTLTLDSSDYRAPARWEDNTALVSTELPAQPGTAGQHPAVSAVARAPGRLYATRYFYKSPWITPSPQPGELFALDPVTLAVQNRVPVGRSPHAIAVHEASQTIYVVNYDDISVSVVDGATFSPLETVKFPGFGLIDVAVSQKFNRVFITQPGQKRILVLDGATRTQAAGAGRHPADRHAGPGRGHRPAVRQHDQPGRPDQAGHRRVRDQRRRAGRAGPGQHRQPGLPAAGAGGGPGELLRPRLRPAARPRARPEAHDHRPADPAGHRRGPAGDRRRPRGRGERLAAGGVRLDAERRGGHRHPDPAGAAPDPAVRAGARPAGRPGQGLGGGRRGHRRRLLRRPARQHRLRLEHGRHGAVAAARPRAASGWGRSRRGHTVPAAGLTA